MLYAHLAPVTEAALRELTATFGLSIAGHLHSALAFFVFEVPKVLMLLALIVFVVGVLQTFFYP